MFEPRQSQINHNSRGGTTASSQNGNTHPYSNLTTPFGSSSSGAGAIDQSIFEKSEGSTPESNSSEDSSGMPKLSKSNKSYTSEEADDPASVHFRGHASNPRIGKVQGPLTASLSSTGEVEDTSNRTSNETEEALIGDHKNHISRATMPPLKPLSPADWMLGFESPDSSKARSRSFPNEDEAHAGSWNAGQLLGPMEPMKIAKPNRNPLRTNVRKLHTLDPSEMSNGELPYIPGMPLHETASQATIGNENASFDASRHANTVNDKRTYRHGANKYENSPSVPIVKNSEPQASVVTSPNLQRNKPHEHYFGLAHGSGYPSNEYSQPGSSQHLIPLIAGANGHEPKFENYSYNHYAQNQKPSPNYESGVPLLPLGPVTNGGPLSFIPSYREEYSSPQHPVTTTAATTTAYPVMFSPMYPVGSVPAVVQSNSFLPLASHLSPDPQSPLLNVLPGNGQAEEKATKASNAVDKLDTPHVRGPAPANVQGRTFKCTQPGCDWSFVRSSDQKRHIRSHQKPSLKCPFWELEPNCNRKGAMFYRLDVLKRHLRLVHLQRSTNGSSEGGICRICSLPFENSRDFIQHCNSCAKNALALKESADITRKLGGSQNNLH